MKGDVEVSKLPPVAQLNALESSVHSYSPLRRSYCVSARLGSRGKAKPSSHAVVARSGAEGPRKWVLSGVQSACSVDLSDELVDQGSGFLDVIDRKALICGQPSIGLSPTRVDSQLRW